jgi:hypothetical protein
MILLSSLFLAMVSAARVIATATEMVKAADGEGNGDAMAMQRRSSWMEVAVDGNRGNGGLC